MYVTRIFCAGVLREFVSKKYLRDFFRYSSVSKKPHIIMILSFLLSCVPTQTSFGLYVSRTWMFMSLLFIKIYSWGTFKNLTSDVCHHLHIENKGSAHCCSTCTCYKRKRWFKTFRSSSFLHDEYTERILTPTLCIDILLHDTMTTSLLMLCKILHRSDPRNLW